MGRVHKSLRIESELAEAVRGLMDQGESEAAAYNRVIRAGVDALEAGWQSGEEEASCERAASEARMKPEESASGAAEEVLESELRDHIATLKAANADLRRQLEVKDGQIEAMTSITKAAQTLHAMTEQKAIAPSTEDNDGGQESKRGFWSRIFG